jgi:hypothetical protein
MAEWPDFGSGKTKPNKANRRAQFIVEGKMPSARAGETPATQNKANLWQGQMGVTTFDREDYGQIPRFQDLKNKANQSQLPDLRALAGCQNCRRPVPTGMRTCRSCGDDRHHFSVLCVLCGLGGQLGMTAAARFCGVFRIFLLKWPLSCATIKVIIYGTLFEATR